MTLSKNTPAITVQPIHFEDHSGIAFERLAFAYLLRTNDWISLEWYGQTGSDSGRDIWGVRADDRNPKGRTFCALCANWRKLTITKVKGDLKKLKKGPTGYPDECVVIGGGAVAAKLRDAIKKELKQAGIAEYEIWSGPEFEERLRAKTESLLERFTSGKSFPDSSKDLHMYVNSIQAVNDDERLALLASLFDRPAFYTPFQMESSIPAFKKAITDTIETLNTGLHCLRDGTEIRRVPSRHHIQDLKISKVLSTIEKKLAKLRASYDVFVKNGDIKGCGCADPDCPVFQSSPMAIQQLDSLRAEILDAFRTVYPKFDVVMARH